MFIQYQNCPKEKKKKAVMPFHELAHHVKQNLLLICLKNLIIQKTSCY